MKFKSNSIVIPFLSHLVVFFLSLFSFSTVLYEYPLVGGRRFLTQLAFPASIFLFLALIFSSYGEFRSKLIAFLKNFFFFIKPFLPFLLCLLLVVLTYSPSREQFFFKPSTFFSYVIFLSFIYATVNWSNIKTFSSELLFVLCSLAIWASFLLLLLLSWEEKKSLYDLREFLNPWVTTFSRCTSLIAGIVFLGSVYCSNIPKKIYYLVSGSAGFFLASIILQTRSVLVCPFLATAILFLVASLRGISRLRTLILPLSFTLLAVLLTSTMISERIDIGIKEISSSGDLTAIQQVIEKVELGKALDKNEEVILSSLNTSMGGRMAAWATAAKITENHWFLGRGYGNLNNFIDVKKVFKNSGNFVKHFHSDYLQAVVVGGLVLLIGMVLSEAWLLLRAVKSKNFIQLYLILSMLFFGLGELAFVDIQTFLIFISAWTFFSFLQPKIDEFTT